MECYHSRANGCTIGNIHNDIVILFSVLGFVDNTSLYVNTVNTIDDLSCHLQDDTQLWADLLHSLGGLLELSKCFYCSVQPKFDSTGNPSIHDAQGLFTVQDPSTTDSLDISF
jgi:hypothetical protein